MGILLSRPPSESKLKDAFIDFEKAKPKTSEEEALYESMHQVLSKAEGFMKEVKEYKSAENLIRKAIQEPTEENSAEAWRTVSPIVGKLRGFFKYAQELDAAMPKILAQLAKSPIGESGYPDLSECMVKQFCDIVSFAFEFDGIKIRNPSIQNDFAYYKRSITKMQLKPDEIEKLPANHEQAALMSMFYALTNPMLTGLCNATQGLVGKSEYKLDRMLDTMIEVTIRMLENAKTQSKFESPEEMIVYLLRVMTGLIIIYDHVNSNGAFHKKSPVDMKAAINVLKSKKDTEFLIDAIRYNTKHFNDEGTPPKIKQLLAK